MYRKKATNPTMGNNAVLRVIFGFEGSIGVVHPAFDAMRIFAYNYMFCPITAIDGRLISSKPSALNHCPRTDMCAQVYTPLPFIKYNRAVT